MYSNLEEFQLIDSKVEEIIRMSSLLARIKGKNLEVEKALKEAIINDPKNMEKVCAYGFYMWFQVDENLDLDDTNTVFKVSINIVDILDELLYDYPEYWILQILKYRIRSFMNFEEKEQISEIKELIAVQRKKKYPSYFLTMDILLSFSYFSIGQYDQALSVLEEIFEIYDGKVHILKEFFHQFIEEYRNIIMRSPEDRIWKILEKISIEYF